ncbi:MAG: hypothetical protein MJ117_02205, partial [Lachnospiraceae bacterium]|nr:hypothetical protein [Lachnospiraceae bacterium]
MNKNTDEELFAEELAASLSRQISGEEIEEHVLDFSEDHSEKLIDLDLLDDLDIEEEKEDPDALLRELQAAVEKEFSTDAEETEAK